MVENQNAAKGGEQAKQLGIETLKRAVTVGANIGNQADESFKDGYQNTDLFAFLDELAAIPGTIKEGPQLIAEFKDRDPGEVEALYAHAKAELKLDANEKSPLVEKFVENAIGIPVAIFNTIDSYNALRALRNKGNL